MDFEQLFHTPIQTFRLLNMYALFGSNKEMKLFTNRLENFK
jgi:hypothetical protein